MKFKRKTCPTCRKPPVHIVESVIRYYPLCRDTEDGDGTGYAYDYDGEDSVCWESSEPVTSDTDRNPSPTGVLLSCPNGHEWATHILREKEEAKP